MQKQTFVQRKRNGMEINSVERKLNRNCFMNDTVFDKDLILEQSGGLWL